MKHSGMPSKEFGVIFKNPAVFQRGYGQCCSGTQRIIRRQNGNGIGNVFAKVYRYFKPLVVKGLKEVGKEAMLAGTDILSQMDDGNSIENALKSRGTKAVNNLKRKATDKLEKLMTGSGEAKKRIKRRKKEKSAQSSTRLTKKKKSGSTKKKISKKQRKLKKNKKTENKDIFD